ncbi:30S ribosomal protein S3 [Halorarius halobius]|uniref:30S ribosomal protein S3 n=1 Tax=Halorarius halobius TaxID=2962671 RepID=UPI0020CD8FED|nr:30S ribosomal protein S3 [Halorarius halobius]
MADEQQFIDQGLQRTQIDEFFAQELSRAGYGGMDLAQTPMGTQIVLKAEKPGMVIGKGGKNIRKLTTQIEEQFDLEDPQIDVQEVEEPDLNAQIVADRLANALERGWYFRKAGHTTIDRIMDSGALGAEIVLSGKVTGARSRVEKFNRGYIKHNGEPAEEIVDRGDGTAVMKLGTIGVQVRIIPPNAELPDDFEIAEDADIEEYIEEAEEGVDDLLAEADEALDDEVTKDRDDLEPEEPAEPADDVAEEEILEEELDPEEGEAPTSPPDSEEDVESELEELEEEIDDLDEETEADAEELMDEMDDAAESDEADETDEADEADADDDTEEVDE